MDKSEFWKRCDKEMREFLLDCEDVQQILQAFDGKPETGPEGVLVFPKTEYTPGKCYWSEK